VADEQKLAAKRADPAAPVTVGLYGAPPPPRPRLLVSWPPSGLGPMRLIEPPLPPSSFPPGVCRHPNYLGEILFHGGVAGLSAGATGVLHGGAALLGPLFMVSVMVGAAKRAPPFKNDSLPWSLNASTGSSTSRGRSISVENPRRQVWPLTPGPAARA
jgi:hypothetical protein